MRTIGTLSNENSARRLTNYLLHRGIECKSEGSFDAQTGAMSYQIWVINEDRISEAAAIFKRFEQRCSDAEFDAPSPPEPLEASSQEVFEGGEPAERAVPQVHQFQTTFTLLILFLCSLFFFINLMQEVPMQQEGLTEQTFLMTPIQAQMLFDLPPAIAALEATIEKNQVPPNQKLDQIPPEVQSKLQAVEQLPFWRGAYDWVVLKIQKKDTSLAEGPLFVRIREGEIWRLFTPCLLHQNLLHILFNMIWVWVLGRPIERRIGFFRTLLLTVVAGVGSNTLQYLMTGPLFLGYSGVVMGLAGFIWMRERVAPWEGYPLNRATVLFLLLFIGAIFALQVVSFLIQIFSNLNFAPNIANTAHIAGGVIGALLARSSFFAQRVKK